MLSTFNDGLLSVRKEVDIQNRWRRIEGNNPIHFRLSVVKYFKVYL